MAAPLDDLQAAYAAVCAKLAALYADPKPSYSVDGVQKSWTEFRNELRAAERDLRAVPGVAPTSAPVFDVIA